MCGTPGAVMSRAPSPRARLDSRKRSCIGAGEVAPDGNENWIGTGPASSDIFPGGGDALAPPHSNTLVTLGTLSALADQCVAKHRDNGKDAMA
eukprot:432914-Pyramimonas_sp.AAC.1